MSKDAKNTAISLMALVVVMAITYGFDRYDTVLLRQARANFNLSPYFWYLSIANLILAGIVLILAWFVCFQENKRILTSVIFLGIGLFGTFAFTATRGVAFFTAPNSRVACVSAFVTVIGVARIFCKK